MHVNHATKSAGPSLEGPPGCEGWAYPASCILCILASCIHCILCILQACILHFVACSLYPAASWMLMCAPEQVNLPPTGRVLRILWVPRPIPKIPLKIDSCFIVPKAPQMEPNSVQELPKWSPEVLKSSIFHEIMDINSGCYLQYFSHI